MKAENIQAAARVGAVEGVATVNATLEKPVRSEAAGFSAGPIGKWWAPRLAAKGSGKSCKSATTMPPTSICLLTNLSRVIARAAASAPRRTRPTRGPAPTRRCCRARNRLLLRGAGTAGGDREGDLKTERLELVQDRGPPITATRAMGERAAGAAGLTAAGQARVAVRNYSLRAYRFFGISDARAERHESGRCRLAPESSSPVPDRGGRRGTLARDEIATATAMTPLRQPQPGYARCAAAARAKEKGRLVLEIDRARASPAHPAAILVDTASARCG